MVFPPSDRHTPQDHLERAEEFYNAYRILRKEEKQPLSWPQYFLFCHAVELALKALLLLQGSTQEEIKKIKLRHNIENLICEAEKLPLPISDEIKELKMLSEAHKDFIARYPKPSGQGIFLIDQFEPALKELLELVSTDIRDGANRRLFVQY